MTRNECHINIIEHTKSVCPECLAIIDARKVVINNDIYLSKKCKSHGEYNTIIWKDASGYDVWMKYRQFENKPASHLESRTQCPYRCGLCSEHEQQTCTAIIEVTSRCNLKCPVCFAGTGEKNGDDPSPGAIHEKYRTLLDAGGPYPVQLSGGEPTERDDLPELVSLGSRLGFKHIQLNTNGVRIARESDYLKSLKEAGLSVVFLQFDGLDDGIYRKIRGKELLGLKLAAIENCAGLKIGVVLVPTVTPGVNEHQLGAILRFAAKRVPVVKGVHFQPITYTGRYPKTQSFIDPDRITLTEIIENIEVQTAGEIKKENFTPPGCEHSSCSFSGVFVLLENGRFFPLTGRDSQKKKARGSRSKICAAEQARKFVSNRWRFT